AVAQPDERNGEPDPENLYEEIKNPPGALRQPGAQRIHRKVRAAPVGDRDGEEDDPDMGEDLELLAPAERAVEDEAVEDLQQPDHAHCREDRRDAVFDAAVDPGKDFFQISAFF